MSGAGDPQNQFRTLALDGSAVHAAWAQLYRRLGNLLARAIERKREGTSCFARPEADIALISAVAVMHAIDPAAGWLDAGLTTNLYSVDDALRRAPEIWWGHDWLDPVEGRLSPFDNYNAAALLVPGPRTISASKHAIAHLLMGTIDLKPPEKPTKEVVERRRRLYDLIVQRTHLVRGFVQRPDKSFPKVKPVQPEAIPTDLGEPLWRNRSYPPLREPGTSYLHRFGHVLMRGLRNAMSEAERALDRTPSYLGLEVVQGYEKYDLPRLKVWLDCGPFPVAMHGLLDAAILDRILGAPPGELLSACLAASRYAVRETEWSLPYAPKWLHVEQWDSALLSCMTNDEHSLAVWLQHYPQAARHYPPGTRACDRVLDHWVRHRDWPDDLVLPKSLDKFEQGFVSAMRGLARRDAETCARGVRQMLENYSRIDYRQVQGRWFFDLCLQAIAVQRMAKREGLQLEVSQDPPNDLGVVTAPDPVEPVAPWVPLPGIELVAKEPGPIAWPSLYLNQPVREVIDAPSE